MAEASSDDRPERRAHLLRKLHDLAGAWLAGLFVVHLIANASALGGQASFDRVVGRVHGSKLFIAFEVLFVVVPLTFYVVHGFVGARAARNTEPSTRSRTSPLDGVRRGAGLLFAAFLIAHVWELRIARVVSGWGVESLYPKLVEHLSSTAWGLPLTGIGYLTGLAASAFFIANSLSRTFAARGLVSAERRPRANIAFAVIGVAIFLLGAVTVLTLATGRILPAHDGSSPDPRCGSSTEGAR